MSSIVIVLKYPFLDGDQGKLCQGKGVSVRYLLSPDTLTFDQKERLSLLDGNTVEIYKKDVTLYRGESHMCPIPIDNITSDLVYRLHSGKWKNHAVNYTYGLITSMDDEDIPLTAQTCIIHVITIDQQKKSKKQ